MASNSWNPLAASFKVLELQTCLQFFFALFIKAQEMWTWDTGDRLPLSRKRVVVLGKAGASPRSGWHTGYGAPPFLVRRGTLPKLVSCLCRQTQPHLFSSRPSKWQLLPSTPPLWRWRRVGGLSWIKPLHRNELAVNVAAVDEGKHFQTQWSSTRDCFALSGSARPAQFLNLQSRLKRLWGLQYTILLG